jgi:hypothetical protein
MAHPVQDGSNPSVCGRKLSVAPPDQIATFLAYCLYCQQETARTRTHPVRWREAIPNHCNSRFQVDPANAAAILAGIHFMKNKNRLG